jgi:hypothetical protein
MRKKVADLIQPLEGKATIFSNKFLYDESIKYIYTVANVGALSEIPYTQIKDKAICYVFDISDYSDYFQEEIEETTTHYFYLEDASNYQLYGYDTDYGLQGWSNVSTVDITNFNSNETGARLLYIESIIDEYKGNNPHAGYGKYDDGEEYLTYFRQLFKYAINNSGFTDDAYECVEGELKNSIVNAGFDLEENIDNVKVWYFYDNEKSLWYKKETTNDGNEYIESEDVQYDIEDEIDSFYDSNLTPYDFEKQEFGKRRTESSALSVINEKRMTLTFDGTYTDNESFRRYYYKTINQYVKQVIPSTTIFEVKFNIVDSTEIATNNDYGYAVGLTESSEVLVERYNNH